MFYLLLSDNDHVYARAMSLMLDRYEFWLGSELLRPMTYYGIHRLKNQFAH